ncbi:uncharacterized protein LOC131038711 [Cryptomeria japonica]|uniref:uncharacterized protein LOC131038711 n=1 Tax=Cryptomeria japonica TaxID=3369 RepID=UPI0027D9DE5E|nr:uncharacterized protein LOC131038711 [Cryptomeria japonica]
MAAHINTSVEVQIQTVDVVDIVSANTLHYEDKVVCTDVTEVSVKENINVNQQIENNDVADTSSDDDKERVGWQEKEKDDVVEGSLEENVIVENKDVINMSSRDKEGVEPQGKEKDVVVETPTKKNIEADEQFENNDVANTLLDDKEKVALQAKVEANDENDNDDDKEKVIQEVSDSADGMAFPIIAKGKEETKIKKQGTFKIVIKSIGRKVMQTVKYWSKTTSKFFYFYKK